MCSPFRRIIHIDMDAFYASVEQRDNPNLRGKPVAVGGRPENRGVVAAASYEARTFGVRSALSMAKAVRRCPELLIVRPDFTKYRNISKEIFQLFRTVTPNVEPLSLDEAYLDVTENAWGEPLAMTVARRLKHQIREQTHLTASAGVAPNKFLAKIASAWQKPDGLTVVPHERVEAFLQQLPVEALWGVGPVTARKLRKFGIKKLVDLRRFDEEILTRVVGQQADYLRRLAHGIDDRPIVSNRAAKSHSSENTYAKDLDDLGVIKTEIDRMARQVATWLRCKAIFARSVTIKVRYSDFTTITRCETRVSCTHDAESIARRAVALLDRTAVGERPIRLLGVGVHNLTLTPEATDGSHAHEPLLWDAEIAPVARSHRV